MGPELLVLDEPSAGLDPLGRERILSGIKKYREETDGSVVIVSHSMEDVAAYCDHLIVMNKGTVYKTGDTKEIFSDPDDLFKVGLDVPQITRVTYAVRDGGVNIDPDCITVGEAKREILSFLNKRRDG